MEPQENHQTEPLPVEIKESRKAGLNTQTAIIIAGVIIAAAIVLSHRLPDPSAQKNAAPQVAGQKVDTSTILVPRPNDHIDGDISKAQVAIYEYSDSDCPFCQRFHPTLQQIRKEYGDKVAWVYRYYPLTMLHPNARNEAIALECASQVAGNDGFWNYLNRMINVKLDATDQKGLVTNATALGIDGTKFTACLNDPAAAATVDAETQEAQNIGAQGTPYSVAVNLKTKKQVEIPGAYPIEEERKMIDSIF